MKYRIEALEGDRLLDVPFNVYECKLGGVIRFEYVHVKFEKKYVVDDMLCEDFDEFIEELLLWIQGHGNFQYLFYLSETANVAPKIEVNDLNGKPIEFKGYRIDVELRDFNAWRMTAHEFKDRLLRHMQSGFSYLLVYTTHDIDGSIREIAPMST